MTELGFLIHILLHHKLVKATAVAIEERIKEVEAGMAGKSVVQTSGYIKAAPLPPHIAAQAPSTQAIMLRNPDLFKSPSEDTQGQPIPSPEAPIQPEPVAIVAQTQATAAAMASRQQAINESISGKVDKQTGRPRKF